LKQTEAKFFIDKKLEGAAALPLSIKLLNVSKKFLFNHFEQIFEEY
jgi:hypothetical protein